MSLLIYGDFDHCGYSRAAKEEGEAWARKNKRKVSTVNLPISALLAFKDAGIDSKGTFKAILKKIKRKRVNLTLPIIFYRGTWVTKGYEGLKATLDKSKGRKVVKRRRSRSRSRSRSK